MFSRRKLESNWDRYQDLEKLERDDDVPTCRGMDFDVLLAAAGDSFSQFRFTEEKAWGMNSSAINETTASMLDLPALADLLQQLPLHQRLDLEPELFQPLVVEDSPTSTFTPKQEVARVPLHQAPSASFKSLAMEPRTSKAKASVPAAEPRAASSVPGPLLPVDCDDGREDDADELLDQLLSLGQQVSAHYRSQTISAAHQGVSVPRGACSDMKEVPKEVVKKDEDKEEEEATPPRKEVTEEELEDWLDSMIS